MREMASTTSSTVIGSSSSPPAARGTIARKMRASAIASNTVFGKRRFASASSAVAANQRAERTRRGERIERRAGAGWNDRVMIGARSYRDTLAPNWHGHERACATREHPDGLPGAVQELPIHRRLSRQAARFSAARLGREPVRFAGQRHEPGAVLRLGRRPVRVRDHDRPVLLRAARLATRRGVRAKWSRSSRPSWAWTTDSSACSPPLSSTGWWTLAARRGSSIRVCWLLGRTWPASSSWACGGRRSSASSSASAWRCGWRAASRRWKRAPHDAGRSGRRLSRWCLT